MLNVELYMTFHIHHCALKTIFTKKTMRTALYVIILIMLSSCSKETTIEGTWELEKMDYSEFLKTIPKELRGNMKKMLNKQIQEFEHHTFFEFRKDKTIELIYPNEYKMTIKGSYSFSKNLDSIFLEKDDPESFKIVELSKEKLILKTNSIPKRTLNFKRNK